MNAQGASPINLVDLDAYRRRREARREPAATAPPEPLVWVPAFLWAPFYRPLA